MPRVSRGLLKTEEKGQIRPVKTPEEKTEYVMGKLQAAPLKDYQWKEYYDLFRRLAQGKPDMFGRRLMDPELETKAQYVASTCHRASLGNRLPQGNGWAYLRHAILAVYRGL